MRSFIALLLVAMALSACSIKKVVIDIIGDAVAGDGDVYAADDDPDLVREAVPFGLKTYESLLAVSPEHEKLLLAAATGFTGYAFLLQKEAERLDAADLARSRQLRARASRIYLRGRDYALRGLSVRHPGFTAGLFADRDAALAETTAEDVPYLYWAGAAWAGALSAAKDDLSLIAELDTAGTLVRRVLELDETYERGGAHEFFISFEGSRPGGSAAKARHHYRRALDLSAGVRASVHLALAEEVSVREQNLEEFHTLLAAALAVDPDGVPELRLRNVIARRRALWLRSRVAELFVEAGSNGRLE